MIVPFVGQSTRRWLTAAAIAWLLAAAFDTTLQRSFARAAEVHVRWAASVDTPARVEAERQFGLVDRTFDSGQTWFYLLQDLSTDNIRAIVTSPAVEDTHFLDRRRYRVSRGAPRRGPFLTQAPQWIPVTLERLAALFAFAGAAALLVPLTLGTARGLSPWFSRGTDVDQSPPVTETVVWLVMAVGLVLIWRPYFHELRHFADESDGFRVGDWLVSYEAGFTRRGLFGSPILWLTSALHVSPETIVLWIQTAVYSGTSLLLFILARGRRLNVWFLAFLFSPAGLLFPLYDDHVIGRKDVLFFAAFALYAWWMPASGRWRNTVVTFVLGAAMTLTHELFFFVTPYFFVMRLLQPAALPWRRRFAPECALAAGSLLALLLVSTVGAQLHGAEQCAGLVQRGFRQALCDGILRYPVTTIAESERDVVLAIHEKEYLRAYPTALLLAALPLLPLVATLRRRPSRTFWVALVGAWGFSAPMLAIMLDWGRLLNINVMATATIMLAFVLEDCRTPGSVFGVRAWWLRAAVLVAFFAYATTWSIRHCCAIPLRAGIFSTE